MEQMKQLGFLIMLSIRNLITKFQSNSIVVVDYFNIRHRDRLLYYFYRRGEVHEDELVKRRLSRMLGYKSVGHFSRDFERLLEEEFIEFDSKRRAYRITRKGRREFLLLIMPRYISLILCIVGATMIFESAMLFFGITINYLSYLISGIVLFFMGLFFNKTVVKSFERKLSSEGCSQVEKDK